MQGGQRGVQSNSQQWEIVELTKEARMQILKFNLGLCGAN